MFAKREPFVRRFSTAAVIVVALAAWTGALALLRGSVARAQPGARPSAERELRVCADANNLPFSNARGEGFENHLAQLLARRMGARVSYAFWPQRRGFVRNTLEQGRCDLVIGVPARFELTENTRPYYRSSYVFVSRVELEPAPQSLDDPLLRTLRVGVHFVGDDYANVPPAMALARRGIVNNVRGYSIYGDYSQPNPSHDLFEALEQGEIEVAIAWGPLAGPLVKRAAGRLRMSKLTPESDAPGLPMSFEIAMGVRRGNHRLRAKLDQVLSEEREAVRALLTRFGVPFEPPAGPPEHDAEGSDALGRAP